MKRSILLPFLLLLPLLAAAAASPAVPPAPGGGGRGPLFDFDISTDRESYEANVSDPSVPSCSVVVTVKNNATAPVSVRLSVSVNLGGTAIIEPSRTGMILYQGTATALVSVTLPENSPTALVGTLRIEGVCEQNAQVTDFKQVPVTVRQWHSLRIQNVSLSSSAPVEREVVQISGKVWNKGNGPSLFMVSAFVDGKKLRARVNGVEADENFSIRVEPGKFVILSATWKAAYGHHNFLLQAEDVGAEEGNVSSAISTDSKMVDFFVGINFRDWTPYLMAMAVILAAAGVAVFRYRKRLAARFPRFGRVMHIKLPPPGPRAVQLQRTLKAGVKRAKGAAARAGQRPLPRYVSNRVRSDIERIRARAVPKGPPPGPKEVEKMKPKEGRGLR